MRDRDIIHQPVILSSLAEHYAEFGVDFLNEDPEYNSEQNFQIYDNNYFM